MFICTDVSYNVNTEDVDIPMSIACIVWIWQCSFKLQGVNSYFYYVVCLCVRVLLFIGLHSHDVYLGIFLIKMAAPVFMH